MAKLCVSCAEKGEATCSLYGHLNSEVLPSLYGSENVRERERERERRKKKPDYRLQAAHVVLSRIITPFNELFVGCSPLAGNRLCSLNISRTNLPDEQSVFRHKID